MKLLIIYHSRLGTVQRMARLIARGAQSVADCDVVLRSVPELTESGPVADPDQDATVTLDDLKQCHGLIIGSPTRFGNMSAAMKHFLDSTSGLWMSGALQGKPAGVFTSSSSMHGGQESTLLSMMNPLLHHGMIIAGLPYTLPELHKTQSGGTPYGPSHVAGSNNDLPISDDEKALCLAFGKRIAQLAVTLAAQLNQDSAL
ncbi:MAG: NAD(P)H:quinone oxidoreductase [Gammaproteobacteria bacterium]|nr:NAD(P)H:quinone oxidoreductase [Gammaproteobacteria bacterium]